MSIDTEAYLFVHFIGEERNPTDEQLYFALSRDGVHWTRLPQRPVFLAPGERGQPDGYMVFPAQAPVAAAARKPEVAARRGFFKSLMDKLF